MTRPEPLTEWEYRVFIAFYESGSPDAAAARLAPLRGTYSRQAVQRIIKKIENRAAERLFDRNVDRALSLTPAGQRALQDARQVVALYERITTAPPEVASWALACSPHHTHFVALAEDRLRNAGDDTDKIQIVFLDQQDRGERQFLSSVVDRLIRGEYQLIIGPSVRNDTLRSTPLYRARIEAMIDRDYPRDHLTLAELVADYEAFLQPGDIRARLMLEDAIVTSGVADPGTAVRVAMETYETATSVMRLLTERRGGGRRGRVVVIPSDVALAYKTGMEFGGRGADRFKWVPVHAGTSPLRLETCVTVRRDAFATLRPVIDALQAGVADLEGDVHRLSGTPAVPAQRS